MDLVKPFIEHMVYPMMESRKGNRIRTYLSELKYSQTLAPNKLEAMQRSRLKKLVDVCVKEVPAYKMPDGVDDGKLPTRWRYIAPLSRDELIKHPEKYLAASAKRETLISSSSGGSTGEPVKFFLDRCAVEHYEAARWRGLSWWGISPGSRSVMLWGSPIDLDKLGQASYRRKEKWLKNRIVIPAYALSPAELPQHIKTINRYRPEYIYGYASALYSFAELMIEQSLRLAFKPKIILSTSEMLFDFQRQAIKKAFHCPVVNEYGARDGGILAYECPHGGMHITCENTLLEVLDANTLKPLPVGERGLLAVTDLHNLSMPRMRYLLGDMASLSSATCPCGMTLPLLGSLEGRFVDMLMTPQGTLVHGHAFVRLARLRHAVRRFQITQHTPAKATLLVVKNPSAETDDTELFISQVRDMLPGTKVEALTVDDIPPTASGKHCYAVREFELKAYRPEAEGE